MPKLLGVSKSLCISKSKSCHGFKTLKMSHNNCDTIPFNMFLDAIAVTPVSGSVSE